MKFQELCCKMPELCDDGIFEVCNKEIAFKNYDLVMRNCVSVKRTFKY